MKNEEFILIKIYFMGIFRESVDSGFFWEAEGKQNIL